MTTYNDKTEDGLSRQIKPILSNTEKDGSGTFYFPVVDSNGCIKITDGDGAYTTATHTAVTVGATTTVALAANTSRLYALFENDSNEAVYLKLGAAAVLNQGILLTATGGSYEMSRKLGNLYTGAVNCICASGNKVLLVLQGT